MSISDFPEPFNRPNADAVLCSSDGVHFRVYRLILSGESPFFRDLFQSVDRSSVYDGLPLKKVDEDSITLDAVLRICFSAGHVQEDGEDMIDIGNLLHAGEKYAIPSVFKRARTLLRKSLVKTDPLRAYVLACRHKLREEARVAASHFLKEPILDLGSLDPTTLRGLSAVDYHSLLMYHRQCGKAAQEVVSPSRGQYLWLAKSAFVWAHEPDSGAHTCESAGVSITVHSASQPSGKAFVVPVLWWKAYMDEAGRELVDRPYTDVLSEAWLLGKAQKAGSRCPACASSMYPSLTQFLRLVGKEVQRAIDSVKLDTHF